MSQVFSSIGLPDGFVLVDVERLLAAPAGRHWTSTTSTSTSRASTSAATSDTDTVRPQHQATANGSYFFYTGIRRKRAEVRLQLPDDRRRARTPSWPGNGNFGDLANFNAPVAHLTRQAVIKTEPAVLQRLPVGHVHHRRPDGQRRRALRLPDGRNLGSTTPAQPGRAGPAPDRSDLRQDRPPFTWENVVPRIGVTYALGKDKRDAAAGELLAVRGPARQPHDLLCQPGRLSAIYYYWNDANGDKVVTRDELNLNDARLASTESTRRIPARRSRRTSSTRT